MDYAETKEMADRLGLRFEPAKSYILADDYAFLHHLAWGGNRYAFNVLSGRYRQNEILAFDYHYEKSADDSNRENPGPPVFLTAVIVLVPAYFPELHIAPEGWLAKTAEQFGGEDIDFESAEFSRAFCVRSKDKRLAYGVCNPRVIDYLLENRDLNIQIQNCTLALVSDVQLPAKQVEYSLERLSEIRARLPDYLFTNK